MIGIGLQMALASDRARYERENATKYIAFDIGCIECGEPSKLIGIFDSREKAQAACDEAEEIQQKPENWTGEHWCEVFEWDGKIS